MTAARRATVLVIVTLASATCALWATIATTRPAKSADDPQSFWREPAPVPLEARRRARHSHSKLLRARALPGISADRARPSPRVGAEHARGARGLEPDRRSVLGGARPFAGAVVLRQAMVTPADVDDSFARRSILPPPLKRMYLPPMLLPPIDPPLPVMTPRPEPKVPGNNRARQLCAVAVIVVAVLGGVLSSVTISQRGIVHGRA